MKRSHVEVIDKLEDIEETLKGLYVAVLIADAEPDSITSENMAAYMRMLSLIVDLMIQEIRKIKEILTEE